VNEQILINVTPQESRVSIMEQGAVQELHVERMSNRGLVGNVYLGKVGHAVGVYRCGLKPRGIFACG
jgi:Ribonuclease G/E